MIMKISTILTKVFLIIIIGFLTLPSLQSQEVQKSRIDKNSTFYKEQEAFNKQWEGKRPEKGSGWKQFKRAEWFWEQRLYPSGEMPSLNLLYKNFRHIENAEKNAKSSDKELVNVKWEPIGPFNVPDAATGSPSPGNGRINCIAFNPNSSSVLWVGAPNGGVWKSNDRGNNWETFPFTEFMSIGVTDIAVSPNKPDVVYVATGDADAVGMFHISRNYSIGVIKTTDNGATWKNAGLQAELNDNLILNRILVHPTNENLVYVASNSGIYKTTDGGDNWLQIYNAKGCRDFEFKADNPDILIGSFFTPHSKEETSNYCLGVFDTKNNSIQITKQFNGDEVSRIAVAVTPDDPKYVYALCAASDNGFHSLLLSGDAGKTWVMVNSRTKFNYLGSDIQNNSNGGQGNYDLGLAASPNDKNEIYIGGVNLWKSTDGGKNFLPSAEWTGHVQNVAWVHADIHDIDYNPVNGVVYVANDGGVHSSSDGGKNWDDKSNSLNVSAYYAISAARNDKGLLLAGAQDCGTHKFSGGKWKGVHGGDGMTPLVDYVNPSNMYCSIYSGFFYRSTNGGSTFIDMINPIYTGEWGDWVTPITIHPTNPQILFIGYTNVWKSSDRGVSWNKISNFTGSDQLQNLVVAPSNPAVIYAAYNTSVWATYDNGVNWEKIITTNLYITDLAVHPSDPGILYYTLSGYSNGSKVYEYSNKKSKNISYNLPNIPANTIVCQDNTSNRIFIGTDYGVYVKENSSNTWERKNNGLPNLVVTDLVYHKTSGYLLAATFGRGVWQTKITDCNLIEPVLTVNGAQAPEKISLCDGESVVIAVSNPQAAYSYEWSDGAKGNQITISKTGDYFVTAKDAKECTAVSPTVKATVYERRAITITVKGGENNNTFCDGDEVELTATLAFSEYKWSNGDSSRKIIVKNGGAYTVTGVSSYGCESVSEPVTITFLPAPEKPSVTKDGNTLTCSDAKAYQWYYENEQMAGKTEKTLTADKSGNYSVEIFGNNGCTTMSDQILVSLKVKDIKDFVDYFNISPNPTNGQFAIEINSGKYSVVEISVIDEAGKMLISPKEYSFSEILKASLDITNNASGVYYIRIKLGENEFIKRIIKK